MEFPTLLLMLEDDEDRLIRFRRTLRLMDLGLELRVWADANVMMREVISYLPLARLISLDHDLEPQEGRGDPGDGLMVAKFLVAQPIRCEVIIHSSNTERAIWMSGEFQLAGWRSCRVPPIGDDWIEVDWRDRVSRILHRPPREGNHQRGGAC